MKIHVRQRSGTYPIEHQLKDSGAKVLVVLDLSGDKVDSVIARLDNVIEVGVIGVPDEKTGEAFICLPPDPARSGQSCATITFVAN